MRMSSQRPTIQELYDECSRVLAEAPSTFAGRHGMLPEIGLPETVAIAIVVHWVGSATYDATKQLIHSVRNGRKPSVLSASEIAKATSVFDQGVGQPTREPAPTAVQVQEAVEVASSILKNNGWKEPDATQKAQQLVEAITAKLQSTGTRGALGEGSKPPRTDGPQSNPPTR